MPNAAGSFEGGLLGTVLYRLRHTWGCCQWNKACPACAQPRGATVSKHSQSATKLQSWNFLLRLCQNQKTFKVFDFSGLLRSILTQNFSTLSDFPLVVYLFSLWSWYSLLYINDSGRLCEGCIGVCQKFMAVSMFLLGHVWASLASSAPASQDKRLNIALHLHRLPDSCLWWVFFPKGFANGPSTHLPETHVAWDIASTSYTNTYTMRHWQVQLTQVPNLFFQLVLESRAESSF